jgi:soluble lytic murein transglycosylase
MIKRSAIIIAASFLLLSANERAEGINKAEPVGYHVDVLLDSALRNFDSKSLDEKLQIISKFRNTESEARSRQKSAYVMARVLNKGGSSDELKQAIPLYEEASEFAPLYERSQWHIVDCANTLGNEPQVRQTLNKILSKTKSTQEKSRAHYSLAQSYLRASEKDNAQEEFNNAIKAAPESQFATGSLYYLGQFAFDNKNYELALKYWRDYLQKSSDGRFARDIANALTGNAEVKLNPADHQALGDVFYRNSECTRALAEYKNCGDDKNWYKQADCLLRMRKIQEAKDAFTSGINKYPTDPQSAEAAKTLARIGTRAEAIAVWKMMLETCPSFADQALYNLGTRASGDEAVAYFDELCSKYPKSELAPDASWWIIWDQIKSGKYAEALPKLKQMALEYETSRFGSKFNFWVGKLEEKLNHKEAAIRQYQHTNSKFGNQYYGWRAYARHAALVGKSDPGWSTDLSKHLQHYNKYAAHGGWSWPMPPQLVSFTQIASEGGQTLACLAELHQWDECLELIPSEKLVELKSLCFAKMNLPLQAINNETKDLNGRPNSHGKWQIAYPLLHSETIKTEAKAKSVDPFLAQALIREESRYNPGAISSSNALGLMQLLPGTAMGVAKRLGLPIKSNDDIHRPENNLKLGIDYLGYTLKRFDGQAIFAVASYNGGPNAVASWKKQFPIDDLDIFVENIPFRETRDYVRKVFASYWNYSAIYDDKIEPAKTVSSL